MNKMVILPKNQRQQFKMHNDVYTVPICSHIKPHLVSGEPESCLQKPLLSAKSLPLLDWRSVPCPTWHNLTQEQQRERTWMRHDTCWRCWVGAQVIDFAWFCLHMLQRCIIWKWVWTWWRTVTHTHTNKFYTLLLVKKTGCTIQLYATVVGSGTYFVEENSIRAGRERK